MVAKVATTAAVVVTGEGGEGGGGDGEGGDDGGGGGEGGDGDGSGGGGDGGDDDGLFIFQAKVSANKEHRQNQKHHCRLRYQYLEPTSVHHCSSLLLTV